MKDHSKLLWIVLLFAAASALGLAFVAWQLAQTPMQRTDPEDMATALASIEDMERTRIAGLPPATPLVLTPDVSGRPPTAAPGFRVLPPTFTPAQPAEIIFGDPAVVLGEPAWIFPFDNAPVRPVDDNTCARASVDGGFLTMTGLGARSDFCLGMLRPEVPAYYLEVSLTPLAPCRGGEFGLYYRGTAGRDGTLFGLNCDGRYSLAVKGAKNGGLFLPLSTGDSLNRGAGQTNRIGVLVKPGVVALYANGALLAEVPSEGLSNGELIGLFVRASAGEPVSVEFDDLRFWDLWDINRVVVE